ncbi:G10 protein [Carpediemonas membranifera]|uniref:G10 protein n=1 Tax=Carpediemonas membranifera TaxID=201153 RepID=A0A8J6AUD2_9EUKA|nr:G10 protein [Carpediemonas membranifera]|eukprot:KAG9394951.1 G10 protein [Carpediemonas membranifera]
MVKLKTKRGIKPPMGYEDELDVLEQLNDNLRAAALRTATDDAGDSKQQAEWDIYRADHQRTRYVHDLMHNPANPNPPSKEFVDYCVAMDYINRQLLQTWRKAGYECACCVPCTRPNPQTGTVCICRIPKAMLPEERRGQPCVTCGCRGCATEDM